MKWIRITKVEDIPIREGRAVDIAGAKIAIFNLGDRFVAVSNECPHGGGPLADGIVSGDTVVCPLHGWKVCLSNGSIVKPEARACVDTFAVRVEDGVVLLELPFREEIAA